MERIKKWFLLDSGGVVPIQNVSAPVIQGNHWEEGLLYVTDGAWKGRPYIFTYQWKRDDVNIDGATLQKYTPVNADVGATVTCEVTASDGTNSATITATASEIVDMYPTKVMSYSPFAYFRLNETSGTTADNYEGTSGRDAVIRGPNWVYDQSLTPDGFPCLKKTTANNNIDIYNAINTGGFNGNVGSILGWVRANSADDWVTSFQMLTYIYVNNSNRIQISRNAGVVSLRRFGGGVDKQIDLDLSTLKPTGNLCLLGTWDINAGTGGQLKFYADGVLVGTVEGIGTWVGTPISTSCTISANSTTNTASWLQARFFDFAYFNTALNQAAATDLAIRSTGKWWYHSIKKTFDINALFSVTDRCFVRFYYDVDNDGERELVVSLGGGARWAAIKSDNTVVWDVTQDATVLDSARHPFIKNGILYHTHGTTLYAIRLTDGSLVWSTANVPTNDLRGGNDYIVCLNLKDLRLYNYSDGTLANSVTLPYSTGTQTLSFGDIDGDGLDEYFTNDYAGRIMARDHDLTELFTTIQYDMSHVDYMVVMGVDKLVAVIDTDNSTIEEGDEIVILDRSGAVIHNYDFGGEQVQYRVLPEVINGVKIMAGVTDGSPIEAVGLDEDLNLVFTGSLVGDRPSIAQIAGDAMWVVPNTEDESLSAELGVIDIRNRKDFLFYHVDSGVELDSLTSPNIDAGYVVVAGTDTAEYVVPHIIRENEFIVGDVSLPGHGDETLRVHQWTLEDIP